MPPRPAVSKLPPMTGRTCKNQPNAILTYKIHTYIRSKLHTYRDGLRFVRPTNTATSNPNTEGYKTENALHPKSHTDAVPLRPDRACSLNAGGGVTRLGGTELVARWFGLPYVWFSSRVRGRDECGALLQDCRLHSPFTAGTSMPATRQGVAVIGGDIVLFCFEEAVHVGSEP